MTGFEWIEARLRRLFTCRAWIAVSALLLMAAASQAQGVFTVIVPTPPGGPIDRVARIVAQALQAPLGEAVIIDNKPGAGGKIGVQAALRAPRNGRTLIAMSPSITSVNPLVDKAAGYDALRDLDLLGIVAANTGIVAVRADLPVRTLAELVAYAKANPEKLTYGSFGIGTSLHLQSEELLHALGITARHIPYKGEALVINALVAGEIDLMTYATMPIVPFVENGRVRALATTGGQRWSALPNVPSIAESGIAGVRGYEYRSWVGLALPAGTEEAARSKVVAALREALARPETRTALEGQGLEPVTGTGDAMRQTVAAELERNRRVIDSGIKLE